MTGKLMLELYLKCIIIRQSIDMSTWNSIPTEFHTHGIPYPGNYNPLSGQKDVIYPVYFMTPDTMR